MSAKEAFALRGTIATLLAPAELGQADASLCLIEDGLVVIDEEGRIARVGPAAEIALPIGLPVEDHRDRWILPGFIDLHIHFPQIHCLDAFGGGVLLDWLETCVFPMEARFADPAFARRAAALFTETLAQSGTSTALIFGSQFEGAQEALFEALEARGLRAIVGRTAMTEGPPAAAPLLRSLEESLALGRAELERYHPKDPVRARRGVAIIPRFALSLDRAGLRAFGELYEEWKPRGVWFTTHLAENEDPLTGEGALVRKTFDVPSYLDTYDGRFLPGGRPGGPSFLSRRSIFAHGVHCTDQELARLAAAQSAIAHCPTSQGFLGSGALPLAKVLRHRGLKLGLGSDIGAGDHPCLGEVANAAFKTHMNGRERYALSGAGLLHLLTLGGAEALDLGHAIGSLEVGKEADVLVLDPAKDPLLAARFEQTDAATPAQLFSLLMRTTPALVHSLFVQGQRVR